MRFATVRAQRHPPPVGWLRKVTVFKTEIKRPQILGLQHLDDAQRLDE
jgi:hypothetical protein